MFMWEVFSAVNRKRCVEGFKHALDSWNASDWAVATAGELGEAMNIVKKLNRYRDGIKGNKVTQDVLKKQLARELADTFIYLDLFAQSQGINLPEVVIEVFNSKSDEIGSDIKFRG